MAECLRKNEVSPTDHKDMIKFTIEQIGSLVLLDIISIREFSMKYTIERRYRGVYMQNKKSATKEMSFSLALKCF